MYLLFFFFFVLFFFVSCCFLLLFSFFLWSLVLVFFFCVRSFVLVFSGSYFCLFCTVCLFPCFLPLSVFFVVNVCLVLSPLGILSCSFCSLAFIFVLYCLRF